MNEVTTKKSKSANARKKQKRLSLIFKLTTYIGVALSLAAMIIAFLQSRQAKDILEQTKNVLESTSTKYIGEFPACVDRTNTVLDKARDSILIIQDVYSYGIYSNPEGFEKFIKIISKKKEDGLGITIIAYDTTLQKETRKRQFCNSNDTSLRKQKENFAINLEKNRKTYETFWAKDFSKSNHPLLKEIQVIKKQFLPKTKEETPDYEKFCNMLLEINKHIEKRLRMDHVKIIPTPTIHNMFAWVVDDKEAIFGFPAYFEAKEITFSTQDPNLIKCIRMRLPEIELHKKNN